VYNKLKSSDVRVKKVMRSTLEIKQRAVEEIHALEASMKCMHRESFLEFEEIILNAISLLSGSIQPEGNFADIYHLNGRLFETVFDTLNTKEKRTALHSFLLKLTPEEMKTFCNGFIQDFSHFSRFLRSLFFDPMLYTNAYNALKERLPQFMNEAQNVLWGLQYLDADKCHEVYETVLKPRLQAADEQQVIKTLAQFCCVVYYLNWNDFSDLCHILKQQLPSILYVYSNTLDTDSGFLSCSPPAVLGLEKLKTAIASARTFVESSGLENNIRALEVVIQKHQKEQQIMELQGELFLRKRAFAATQDVNEKMRIFLKDALDTSFGITYIKSTQLTLRELFGQTQLDETLVNAINKIIQASLRRQEIIFAELELNQDQFQLLRKNHDDGIRRNYFLKYNSTLARVIESGNYPVFSLLEKKEIDSFLNFFVQSSEDFTFLMDALSKLERATVCEIYRPKLRDLVIADASSFSLLMSYLDESAQRELYCACQTQLDRLVRDVEDFCSFMKDCNQDERRTLYERYQSKLEKMIQSIPDLINVAACLDLDEKKKLFDHFKSKLLDYFSNLSDLLLINEFYNQKLMTQAEFEEFCRCLEKKGVLLRLIKTTYDFHIVMMPLRNTERAIFYDLFLKNKLRTDESFIRDMSDLNTIFFLLTVQQCQEVCEILDNHLLDIMQCDMGTVQNYLSFNLSDVGSREEKRKLLVAAFSEQVSRKQHDQQLCTEKPAAGPSVYSELFPPRKESSDANQRKQDEREEGSLSQTSYKKSCLLL